MANSTVESYLATLEKSELLTPEQLAEACAIARDIDDPEELARTLSRRELLTRWQAAKVLAGRTWFQVGKYQLIKLLGRGGMGSVFLARHVTMQRQVALKVVSKQVGRDPESLERFFSEARAVAALDNPNIVRAYDVDSEGDRFYIVMEYVEGQDLQEMVEQRGPLDFALAVDYIRQTAQGLAHAHARNMVHCDIKPSNLLVSRQGVVKILDMGLARLVGPGQKKNASDAPASNGSNGSDSGSSGKRALGTVDYLAPEQALDSPDFDHRADIYSLGCTLYFLLTGRPPFPEGSLAQRIVKHQTQEPTNIARLRSDTPEDLIAICRKMMAKDPAQRIPSAEEVVRVMESWRPPPENLPQATPLADTSDGGNEKQPSPPAGPDLDALWEPLGEPLAPVPEKAKPHKSVDSPWLVWVAAGVVVVAVFILAAAVVHRLATAPSLVHERPLPPDLRQASSPEKPDDASEKPGETPPAPLPSESSEEKPSETVDAGPRQPAGEVSKPPVLEPPVAQPPVSPPPVSESPPPKPLEPAPAPLLEPPTPKPAASPGPPEEEAPFSRMAETIALPPVGSGAVELGELTLGPTEYLRLELLGGQTALKGAGGFSLSAETLSAGNWEWRVHFAKEPESATTADVAKIWFDGKKMRFLWLEGASARAEALRYCLLMLHVGEREHLLALNEPKVVEPLAIDFASRQMLRKLPLENIPDPDTLRLRVTALEGPFPRRPAEKSKAIEVNRHDEIQLLGDKPPRLAVRVFYPSDGASVRLTVFYELDDFSIFRKYVGQGQRHLRKSELARLQKITEEAKQVADKLRQQLASLKNAKRASDRRIAKALEQRLTTVDLLLKQATAVFQFCEKLERDGRIHFRVFRVVGGREMDLVTTKAPAGKAKLKKKR